MTIWIFLPGTNLSGSSQAPLFDDEDEDEEDTKTQTFPVCTCDIRTLSCRGCQCGAIQKEKLCGCGHLLFSHYPHIRGFRCPDMACSCIIEGS